PDAARSVEHVQMLRLALSAGGIVVKNLIWDPFSANARAACDEVRSHWLKCFPGNLGLAMGDPERGHNLLLVGATIDGFPAWPASKEKLGKVGIPRGVLDGIRSTS